MPIKYSWFLIIIAIFSCSKKQENSSTKEFFYIQEETDKVVTLPQSIRNVQGVFLEKGFTTIVMPDAFFESWSAIMEEKNYQTTSSPAFVPDFTLPDWSGYQREKLALSEKAVATQIHLDPSVIFGEKVSIGMSQGDFLSLFSEKYNHSVFLENSIIIIRDATLLWLMRCSFEDKKLDKVVLWHQWVPKE